MRTTLARRWWVLALCVIGAALGAFAMASARPAPYVATAVVGVPVAAPADIGDRAAQAQAAAALLRADDRPVQLLADQREVDQVDEGALQLGADGITRVGVERRKVAQVRGRHARGSLAGWPLMVPPSRPTGGAGYCW